MKKRLIVIAVIILALFAGYKIFIRPGGKTSGQSEASREKDIKDLEQKVLSFNIDGRTAKGVKQWHLEGDSAEIMDDEVHFNDLKAVAYGDNVTINLKSDTGIYRKEKGEVELKGNVKVVSDDGVVLTTESAKWSQVTKEISTEEDVRIEQGKMIATGKGGHANSDEMKAMLKKDVTVTIEPDTKVWCDGPLNVNYAKNIAIFYNNVKVKDKDGELFSDKLSVDFDPTTKKIAQVTAEGNVKLRKGKSYTISQKAIYRESTKSAKLIGKPRVIIDPQELEKAVQSEEYELPGQTSRKEN